MDWARTPRGMFERYDARHHGSCLAQLVHEPGATHMQTYIDFFGYAYTNHFLNFQNLPSLFYLL